MLVLWIVLAVLFVVVLTTTVAVGTIRRRPGAPAGRERPEAAPAGGATVLEAERGPMVGAEPAADVEARSGATVEAAPLPEVAAPPRFRDRLGKARGMLAGYVGSIRSRGKVDEEAWEELEEALIRADVGVATTMTLLDDLRGKVSARQVEGADGVLNALKDDLLSALSWLPADGASAQDDDGPSQVSAGVATGAHGPFGGDSADGGDGADTGDGSRLVDRGLRFDGDPEAVDVWLFVGVNGVGKTTTIGKLARRERTAGRSVLLAAGDTFRAAAGEQLAQWAERSGAEIVRGAEGGDPSAIVFDAVQRARARGNDLVLADTAGRLHTKVNLIHELEKVRRVADRPPGRVTEVLLVLDATTGQNALQQAKQFTEAVGVTGVVLTKLDGTAKGGVVVAIQRELGVPVKLVGLGEGLEDLVPFDPVEFVDALLG